MPRKKLIYTHLYPYHICARANNKQNFPLNIFEIWTIIITLLNEASIKYSFQVHAFVLMNNHYHLVASADEENNLSKVMCWLQTSISKAINNRTQRINHVFGGTYKASLITSSEHFSNILKYVYRNPVKAGICDSVWDYKFSTLNNNCCITTCLINGIYSDFPKTKPDLDYWLNEKEKDNINISITMGLNRTVFKPIFNRKNKY